MKKDKPSYQKLLLVFIGSFVIAVIFISLFLNPIVQDAYNKGYQRGINESCPDVMKFCNKEKQVPEFFINEPFNLSLD